MQPSPFNHQTQNPRGQFSLHQRQICNTDDCPIIVVSDVKVRRVVIIEILRMEMPKNRDDSGMSLVWQMGIGFYHIEPESQR
jgi:hypothetical protein